MKQPLIVTIMGVLVLASAIAEVPALYIGNVPEFNTITLGAAVVAGGFGLVLLRKRE